LRRLGDAGDGVGEPAALVHRQHADAAAGAGVGVGHGGGPALVPRRDVGHPGRAQRVRHVEVAAAHHPERVARAQLGDGPPDELGDPHRSTSASTRAGLPEPPTIGSGPATTTAPVGGSWARFCSWVSPYFPAPSRKLWHGNGGSKPCAAPASVPTVSTPSPITGASSASHFAHSTEMPGVAPPFKNASASLLRASQPVR